MANPTSSGLRRLAVIGNYLPRECGIATFTTHLCEAVSEAAPGVDGVAVPVTDTEQGYAYPERVVFELREHDLESYRRALDFLNIAQADVVCLQHEYGIFGGPHGSHILQLVRPLRAPLVTTVHTILQSPGPEQRAILQEIAELSDRVVSMSHRGSEFLQQVYGVPPEKIDVIPHGIPDMPFVDPNFYKDRFGVEGRTVLLTSGFLSRNKGIEYVIEALPEILAVRPDVVYIVLGATHPNVRRRDGETYRLALRRAAAERGVESHVVFFNHFVSQCQLIEFIGAADIYLTPYLNPEQIASGTLAYAVGAGKAVVSTPYWYAQELLADGGGVLVPFRDPSAIARAVIDLLEDEPGRHAMRKRAYLRARAMIWPAVAARYVECFRQARRSRRQRPRPVPLMRPLADSPTELPRWKLAHLRRLTDDTGLLQHAIYTVPNYAAGYTTDDNARALAAAVYLEQVEPGEAGVASDLAARYLAFLWHAFDPGSGRFHNLMTFDRRWADAVGSEDCHARALWGLATTAGRSRQDGLRQLAARLFRLGLPAAAELESPRAWAQTLLALQEYLRNLEGDRDAAELRQTLAGRLMSLRRDHAADGWLWFEDQLPYANALLPHGLIVGGEALGSGEMVEAGLESLSWLMTVQRDDGHFVPIGSNGFYPRGQRRARFDQQPIEAYTTVSACLEAPDRRRVLAFRGRAGFRMVPRPQRPAPAALRSREWWLSRRPARRPHQRQSGRRVDGGRPTLGSRDAPGRRPPERRPPP